MFLLWENPGREARKGGKQKVEPQICSMYHVDQWRVTITVVNLF